MKKGNFKELSVSELATKERELREELEMLTLKKRIGQVAKPHRFSEIRRDIARIMTLKSSAQ